MANDFSKITIDGTTYNVKTPNKLTVGSKTFDGSEAVTIAAPDLGLSNALQLVGETTTEIVDGSTTSSITVNGATHNAAKGDVVLYGSKEFAWTGSKWTELGDGSSHALKTVKISAGGGLTGGGDISTNRTISHADTSSQESVSAGEREYIKSVTLDGYGHVTGLTTGTEQDISGKANLEGGNTFTGKQTLNSPASDGYSINAAGYVKGSLLQAPSTGKAASNTGKVCVLDNSGWVYYRTPAEIVSDGGGANLSGGNTFNGIQTIDAPTDVSDSETTTLKAKTSNGGAIIFGKEGPNSGTMIRLDQTDGTCRLRFRSSATAGAMVWEQPEQGAQLYVDLGKEGSDKHRVTFPSSAGTLALKSDIPATTNSVTKDSTAVVTSGGVYTAISNIPNPNLLINPNFAINQRGQTSYTGSGYGVDRWKGYQLNSMVCTPKSNGVTLTAPTSSTGTGAIYRQVIEPEQVARLAGKTITFSFSATNRGSADIYMRCLTPASVGDTPRIASGVTGIVTKTITLASDITELQFVFRKVSGTLDVDIHWVKLEIGSVATSFSPPSIAEELPKCQRYYQIRTNSYAIETNAIDRPIPMRVNGTTGTTTIDGVTYKYVDAEI